MSYIILKQIQFVTVAFCKQKFVYMFDFLFQVGFPVLVNWFGHFAMLGYYTFLSTFIGPTIRLVLFYYSLVSVFVTVIEDQIPC